MQWQYTMTKQDVRAQIRALTRAPGSIANRQMRRLRLLEPLAVIVAMAVFSFLQLEELPAGERTVEAGFLLLLTAAMALLLWALAPAQYVSIQMSALRASLPDMTSRPYRVTLSEGTMTLEGPGVGGQQGHIRADAAAIRTLGTDRGGLVVVLDSGAGFLMPLSAFSDRQSLPYSLSLFEQARKMQPSAPAQQKGSDGPVRTGFVPDGEGGGTFVQQIDRQKAELLLRERTAAVLKTPACWRRKWPALAVVVLGCGYITWQYGWVGLAVMVVVVAAVLYGMLRRPGQELDRACGTFTVRFAADGIQIADGKGGTWQAPYTGARLLETPHAFVLCPQDMAAGYTFDKAAFQGQAEQQAFLTMLSTRLGA